MKKWNQTCFQGLIALILTSGILYAQVAVQSTATTSVKPMTQFKGDNGRFIPGWKEHIDVRSKEDLNVFFKAPYFDNAFFDANIVNLPYYEIRIPLEPNQEVTSVSINDNNAVTEFSNLFDKSIKEATLPNDAWYPKKHVVIGQKVTLRGRHYQLIPPLPDAGKQLWKIH